MSIDPEFERMIDEIFQSLQNAETAKKEAKEYLKKMYGEKFSQYLKKKSLDTQGI